MVAGEEWAENPRFTVPEAFHAFVRLWAACRTGLGGVAHWPDAGGVNDQAAWLMDAFSALSAMEAKMEKAERQEKAG